MEKEEKKRRIEEEKKKVHGFISEFKTFISRGNVLDLAVGVVVGSAFTKIVTSLVNDIITPLIGIVIGGQNFTGLSLTIGESTIAYGAFIQNIIDFLLIAFCIFVFIKFMNKFFAKKEKEEKKVDPPKKSDEVLLLEEIRDLLKTEKKTKKSSK